MLTTTVSVLWGCMVTARIRRQLDQPTLQPLGRCAARGDGSSAAQQPHSTHAHEGAGVDGGVAPGEEGGDALGLAQVSLRAQEEERNVVGGMQAVGSWWRADQVQRAVAARLADGCSSDSRAFGASAGSPHLVKLVGAKGRDAGLRARGGPAA